MATRLPEPQDEIGMVGLGIMGRNFLLNLADRGQSAAGREEGQAFVIRHRPQGPIA